MNFAESIEYLYNLGNEVLAMKLGLENIGKLLKALNNPEKRYLKIQVAGTNGKGSTCAFLESICLRAKIKVGMTTSPHLISVTERVKINGRKISEADFAVHATLIREISEDLVRRGELETVPTYFEQVTAIALNAFAEAEIDLAILETGLGGRFDATTAADAEIAAITPIDYDHQKILGNSLTEIATEKAAIIRSNTKVFVAPQKSEAENAIRARCLEVGVVPNFVCYEVEIHKNSTAAKNFPFTPEITLNSDSGVYRNLKLNILGRHQYANAALAAAVARSLNDFGFDLTDERIKKGLEKAAHQGRLEFRGNMLFDGAHNAAGAKVLREYLDEFVDQPITMIFGAMKDKDLSQIAEMLFSKAETLIFTKADNARSMEAAELMKFVPANFDKNKIKITDTVEEALEVMRGYSEDKIVLVTGSLYLIGEVQKILKNQSEIGNLRAKI